MTKPIIIYVEGNIGSGKTTFLRLLKQYLPDLYEYNIDASIVLEPVDLWLETLDSDGKNILEKFYEDQEKWGYAFQMNSFISRVKSIKDELNNSTNVGIDGFPLKKVVFVERSIYTDKNCFARLCYENSKMTKLEYDIYCNWNNWLSTEFEISPHSYIYLHCNPNVNNERIIERNRDGESNIPIKYLEQLHEKHEIWMKEEKDKGIPIFTIDSLENFKDPIKMGEIFDKLVKFMFVN